MNCQEVIELMHRYIDQDLIDEEEEQLHAHLQRCTDCREVFERLKRLSTELAGLPKVIPAYSIVDSILPKLHELDLQNGLREESAGQDGAFRADLQGNRKRQWFRQFQQHISWKLVGGVMAAGLVFGFLAFQVKSPLLQHADGLLMNLGSQSSFSSSAKDMAAGSDSIADMGTDKSTEAASKNDSSNSPKRKEANSSKGVSPTAVPTNSPKPSKSQDLKQPIEKPLTRSAAEHAPIEEPSTSINKALNSTVPSPYEDKKMESSKDAAQGPLANPDQDGAAMGSPKVGETSTRAPQNMSLMAAMDPVKLKSPNGVYVAIIDHQKVTVQEVAFHNVVYSSKQVWKDTDALSFVGWSEDGLLTYQVINGETKQQFLIDPVQKKETKK